MEFKDDLDETHRFIVEAHNESTVVIYVAQKDKHEELVKQFGLDEQKIVGGGYLYTGKDYLFLGNGSNDYYPIPQYPAEKFVELVFDRIKSEFPDIKRTIARPLETQLNEFWIRHGFTLQYISSQPLQKKENFSE